MHRKSFYILQDIGHLQHKWIIQKMVSRNCPHFSNKKGKDLFEEINRNLSILYNDHKRAFIWKLKKLKERIYHAQVDSKVLQIMWKDISFRLFDILSRMEDLHSQIKHYSWVSQYSIHFTRYLWLSILIDPQRSARAQFGTLFTQRCLNWAVFAGQGGYLVWGSYSPNIVI